MNAEQSQQQQQQKPQTPKLQKQHSHEYQQQQQQQQPQDHQHHHHVQCSYDKDIVCDDNQMHQHQHQKHNEHWQTNTNTTDTTCTAEYSLPFNQQEQQQTPQHQRHHHMPRKHSHSHSPHPSRHTSPHSRHTSPHSRHTSPHSRHTSPHSRHTSPHSRHTSPHSRHTSPHSRHTSPHSRHTSPHGHGHSHSHSHGHGHSHSHSSPHQSHNHVYDQHQNGTDSIEPFIRNSAPRASVHSTSSHIHAHHAHSHHHRRRKRSENSHTAAHHHANGVDSSMERNLSGHLQQGQSSGHTCTRRHRSVTDISQSSLNTCNDPLCTEREIQEILLQKSTNCCSNSRTELAQYFAEDLYGSSSRRPSSCCTSSDYCYQTDSTSLYGSRSSLSRNNSAKSASVTMRKKKMQQRQPSYSSISLRALNTSRPNSQMGSLTSVFDRAKQYSVNGGGGGGGTDSGKSHESPSKVTIERHTSKDALSNDLPEYACSPSPIRWSFLADGKTNNINDDEMRLQQQTKGTKATDEKPRHRLEIKQHKREKEREVQPDKTTIKAQNRHRSQSRHHLKSRSSSDDRPSTSRKCCESPCKYEESTMVQFHQDAETFNNCCSNYIQCNTYLDQDLQITSEDIHQYLSKGQQDAGNVLNNTKTYPFQPSNALEFQYKNNFANNNTATNTLSSVEGTESMRSFDSRYRRNSSKETNLNQCPVTTETCVGACVMSSCSSTPMSPTNINLSSSTNNINIVFSSCMERNANEVKFINTTSRNATTAKVVSTEAQHAGYLAYTYPSYDYTNMAANSQFNKPLGINEIPQEMMNIGDDMMTITTSSSQHSSSLHSPEHGDRHQQCISFESFDASSGHNLLASQRGSGQYTATPTPRSPLSPASPVNSFNYSVSINPSSTTYSHYDYPPGLQRTHTHHQHDHESHGHHHHHHYLHLRESFKITNAFKKVRKRARKYTDFLRRK